MSINTKVNNLAIRVGTEIKAVRAEQASAIGNTYTQAEVDAALATAKAEATADAVTQLTGSASVYSTLQLIEQELNADDTQAANILTAQGDIRADIGTQTAIASADYVNTFEQALL